MAFAPPRHSYNRPSEQRRRLEAKEKSSTTNDKVAQRVRNVIEARHREWLTIDKNSRGALEDSRENSNFQRRLPDQVNAAFLPHDKDLTVEEFEAGQSSRSGMNSSNGDAHLLLRKDFGKVQGDVSAFGSAYDYNSSINKYKMSKPDSKMSSGSNLYDGRPTVGNHEFEISDQEVTGIPLRQQPEPVSVTHPDIRRTPDDMIHHAKNELYRYGRVSRPENHFCPFCRRLMSFEGHDPVCIIPCGHTLCEPCSKALKKKCPICDHDIQTTTSNVILKRIIEKFSEEQGLDPGRPNTATLQELAGAERNGVAKSHGKQTPVPRDIAQALSDKLDILEQNRRNLVEHGRDVSSHVPPQTSAAVADPVIRMPMANMNSEPWIAVEEKIISPQMADTDALLLSVKRALKENARAEVPTRQFIPEMASVNKAITNLLKSHPDIGETLRPATAEKSATYSNKQVSNADAVILPNELDLEKWAEELAAVEMRISVMDLQARQTSSSIVNTKSRINDAREALKLIETRESQLLDNLRFTQMQLKGIDAERSKIVQQLNDDTAESEKCCEQLNLINYTRAGLEAELEKLRLLCNRT